MQGKLKRVYFFLVGEYKSDDGGLISAHVSVTRRARARKRKEKKTNQDTALVSAWFAAAGAARVGRLGGSVWPGPPLSQPGGFESYFCPTWTWFTARSRRAPAASSPLLGAASQSINWRERERPFNVPYLTLKQLFYRTNHQHRHPIINKAKVFVSKLSLSLPLLLPFFRSRIPR